MKAIPRSGAANNLCWGRAVFGNSISVWLLMTSLTDWLTDILSLLPRVPFTSLPAILQDASSHIQENYFPNERCVYLVRWCARQQDTTSTEEHLSEADWRMDWRMDGRSVRGYKQFTPPSPSCPFWESHWRLTVVCTSAAVVKIVIGRISGERRNVCSSRKKLRDQETLELFRYNFPA